MFSQSLPTLSLPLGGLQRPASRSGRLQLAAMFRAQAGIMIADGDSVTAKGLRLRARGIETKELAADLASGARVIMGVAGHA